MIDSSKDASHAPKIGARDELRLKVPRAIGVNPDLSQRQLAAAVGVSLGGVNYALKSLMERRFMKAENSRKSDRKTAYLLGRTPKGFVEKKSRAASFLGRKLDEHEMLKQEIEALKGEVSSGDSGAGAKP